VQGDPGDAVPDPVHLADRDKETRLVGVALGRAEHLLAAPAAAQGGVALPVGVENAGVETASSLGAARPAVNVNVDVAGRRL
jgi:hypothetical protein